MHLDVTSKLGGDYGENSARVLGWDVRYQLITRGTVKTASCPGIDDEVLTFLGERTETDSCMDHVGLSFEFHGYAAIGPEQVLLLARISGYTRHSIIDKKKL